jgi:hypothetical protein
MIALFSQGPESARPDFHPDILVAVSETPLPQFPGYLLWTTINSHISKLMGVER